MKAPSSILFIDEGSEILLKYALLNKFDEIVVILEPSSIIIFPLNSRKLLNSISIFLLMVNVKCSPKS